MKTNFVVYAVALLLAAPLLRAESPETPKRFTEHIVPTLSIPDAIRISEEFLQNKKRDTSKHFISSVVYHEPDYTKSQRGEGAYWQVTYTLREFAAGGQYFVIVYMDGKVWLRYGI